jgi:hypothetical protein
LVLRVSVSAVALLAMARCSSSSSNPKDAPTSAVIGVTGGTIASADGVFDIIVPPGAVSSDVTMTVTPTNVAPPGEVGLAYGVEPIDTILQAPVTVVFHYASVDLGGKDPSTLFAGTTNGVIWQDLPNPISTAASQTISATTLVFSVFGLIGLTSTSIEPDGGVVATPDAGATEDASNAVCSGTLSPTSDGSNCSINEACNDGHEYSIVCSPTSNTCACFKDSTQTTTAGVTCATLAAASLQQCGYPVGTITPLVVEEAGVACTYFVNQDSDDAGTEDGGPSCSVTENCGAEGEFFLKCNAATTHCTCSENGQLSGTTSQSCVGLTNAAILKCGFPGPGSNADGG